MMNMSIYELFMEESLTDIFVMTRFTCGHSSGYSEYSFYEDEEDDWESFADYIKASYENRRLDRYSDHKIMGTVLYLYIDKNTKCKKCISSETTIFCDEQKKPVGFEHVVIYRGLNAYYGDDNKQKMISLFEDMLNNKDKQICCSTHILGDMGVILTGEVLLASNIDLHSMVQGNRRYFMKTPERMEHIIYNAKDLKPNGQNKNDEIVMRNVTIKCIWLDHNACEAAKEAAEYLAAKHNLTIKIVKTSKRFAR